MKIGILTYHDGINHGTFLQCYSLFRTIENLGHEAEIINYKNFKHWLKEYKSFLWTKNPDLLLKNINKIRKFKKNQSLYKLSKFTFTHKKLAKKHYDKIFIGSDEIWNYKTQLVGVDLAYFGNALNAGKINSYAASFGNVNINDNIPLEITENLKKLENISVRDENSKNIISKLLNIEAPIVVDPTLLYDLKKEEKKCPYKNFILVYATNFDNHIIEKIKKTAKELNKEIISISYNNAWCDKNIISIDAFEMLAYFNNADYVLTNTFHGTIFSILYNKKFLSIPHIGKVNKIKNLLCQFELESRLADNADIEKLIAEIDYNDVNKMIEVEKEKSMKLLITMLK